MAMVFKSEKNLIEPLKKNKDNPGPGEYLPQTKYKKIKINQEPFLSTINGTIHRRNNFPGPGSYYQDDILIKYLKNIQNQKILDNNDKKYSSQTKRNMFNDEKKIEKLGFNSKSKRFNIIIEQNPGPGYYFPKINKYYKNKTLKIKEDEYNSKQRQKSKIKNEFNLIPTIPSKNQKYGFDILEDGKILQKKDPNLYKLFTGEKGDTVGPGTYEVEKKNELYKTRPQWTMSKDIRNCYITNWENMSKIETSSLISTNHTDYPNNFNNSNLLSSITASKFFIDDKLNVFELSPYNISNYSISNYDSQTNLNNSNINLSCNIGNVSNNKNNNSINKSINNNTFNNEKYRKISSRELFKINDNPGPGFYIDRFKQSSFKFKYIPENKQFFGSKIERFHNINNSYDYYYNDDNYLINDNNIKSKSTICFPAFSSVEQRFKIPLSIKEKISNPSPCQYNPKIKKNKSFSNFDKFNTSTKRFIIDNNLKYKNGLPGPGCYNPEEIKKHISTKKFIISNNTKKHNKTNNDFYPINYNIHTIEYNNNKKLNSTNLKNVTFFKCNPGIAKSMSCKHFGPSPGTYYRDKKYEFKQIIPPFNRSSEKKVEFTKKSIVKGGPGQYNHDSYFDWNKKTFNISYL